MRTKLTPRHTPWTQRVLLLVAPLVVPALASAQQPETIEYYGTDAIGSIRIVWNASGTMIARQDFMPFGEPVTRQGTAIPKEGFVGNGSDAETNQDYFHARMFEARTGRFTRTDPIEDGIEDPQRWNPYAYALNNPLAFVDAGGLFVCRNGSKAEFPGDCLPPPAAYPPPNPNDGDCGGTSQSLGRTSQGCEEGGQTRDGGQDGKGGGKTGGKNGDGGSGGDGGGQDGGDHHGQDCTPSGWFQTMAPDYINFQFSIGAFFGVSIHVAVDRYGNGYFGLGPSIGRGIPVSTSLTAGYATGQRTQSNTISVLTKHSFSAGAGVVPVMPGLMLGGGASTNKPFSNGSAYEVGLFTPQIGAGYSYSWMSRSSSTCK